MKFFSLRCFFNKPEAEEELCDNNANHPREGESKTILKYIEEIVYVLTEGRQLLTCNIQFKQLTKDITDFSQILWR